MRNFDAQILAEIKTHNNHICAYICENWMQIFAILTREIRNAFIDEGGLMLLLYKPQVLTEESLLAPTRKRKIGVN